MERFDGRRLKHLPGSQQLGRFDDRPVMPRREMSLETVSATSFSTLPDINVDAQETIVQAVLKGQSFVASPNDPNPMDSKEPRAQFFGQVRAPQSVVARTIQVNGRGMVARDLG